jgi:ferritin
MISKKMTKALNEQINAELYSAYLYLAMSAYATAKGLKGIGKWMAVQTREEMTHAQKQYQYLLDQGEQPEMLAIDKPPAAFKSALDLFDQGLKHEQGVTGRIHNLVNLAIAEKDHATQIFLQWFVTEQVEEEANATEIVNMLKVAGADKVALFMIDSHLGKREFKSA